MVSVQAQFIVSVTGAITTLAYGVDVPVDGCPVGHGTLKAPQVEAIKQFIVNRSPCPKTRDMEHAREISFTMDSQGEDSGFILGQASLPFVSLSCGYLF